MDTRGVIPLQGTDGCVNDIINDRALDAIVATLKAIVDDIVTCGKAFTLDVCRWRSLDVPSINENSKMTPIMYDGSSIKRTQYYLKRQITYKLHTILRNSIII